MGGKRFQRPAALQLIHTLYILMYITPGTEAIKQVCRNKDVCRVCVSPRPPIPRPLKIMLDYDVHHT
jgi:hypothetical protein